MVWEILISIFIWILYIVSTISIIVVMGVLVKILIWDSLKKMFKKWKNVKIYGAGKELKL